MPFPAPACSPFFDRRKASASPELRQHLCLPYKTRRFGRRPYPIVDKALRRQRSGSDPLGPTEDLHIAGGSSTQAGGSQTGELELASPPGMFTQALHAAGGYGVGEDEGRSGFRGGMSGDVVTRWCAEWAVTFSGSLEQGVTKVKVRSSRDGDVCFLASRRTSTSDRILWFVVLVLFSSYHTTGGQFFQTPSANSF